MSSDAFLGRVRARVRREAPHLEGILDVAEGEARFAREWLEDEIRRLPPGSCLLEIGGGTFLLACQLSREGYRVTAVEPVSEGFGPYEKLGSLVLAVAAEDGLSPLIVRCRIEDYESTSKFDFAYSINVMEHVASPELAVDRVVAVLPTGRSYRFLCPNYSFPYEPHFNIPIIFNKRITMRILGRRILSNRNLADPTGVWASLNWISVRTVRGIVNARPTLSLRFQTTTLAWILRRAISDPVFARRRSHWMVKAIRGFDKMRVLQLAGRVPASMQPIMDARLTKRL